MLACLCLLTSAGVQGEVAVEKTSFGVPNAVERAALVVGELRIPASTRERLPAVLLVNSTPGFDGRGAFYAEALNRAGIATLEIDMFQGRGMPATHRHNMPHAYESLQYLARHRRIDPAKVGIMGFSYGGAIAVLSSSDELLRQYSPGRLRFAAHLGLYPVCWRHRRVLDGMAPALGPNVYRRVTGAPVHILVGSKDDYDGTDSCQAFLAALSPQARPHFSLTVYEGATFAWDSRFGSAVYEASARKGKGGIVNVIADTDIASQSREFAAAYFRKHLGAE